jgi:hypothetical protein
MMKGAFITITRCGSKNWLHMHRSTSIGTTGRARTPVLNEGTGCRRAPEAERNFQLRVMGREVVVAVIEDRLDFGTRVRIFYGEFDGRRRERVLVKIIGE